MTGEYLKHNCSKHGAVWPMKVLRDHAVSQQQRERTSSSRRSTCWDLFIRLPPSNPLSDHGAEMITGFQHSETTSRRWADIIRVHWGETSTVPCCKRRPVRASKREARSHEASVIVRHKAGHRIRLHVRAVSAPDQNGSIVAGETFDVHASNPFVRSIPARRPNRPRLIRRRSGCSLGRRS